MRAPGPGKEVGNVRGLQAGIATEETAAAAVTGIMTAEEVMIATMTGKERENLGDLVVMIRGATAGLVHVPQEEVLGIMIDMGVMDVEVGTRCKETLLTFSSLPCTRCSRWTILRGGLR